ncbi:GGDEF domain-containing protein [Cellulomonas sp. ATA003]|uniref:GGDEF domain-containing protein n=1 Tax=Cellulomonas sp. ATA003 TaxID=3073064 RepID=UPI002873BD84|nr:GGDEF domain-containing protein [Cellulomonas sp. ATA003]WNB86871.1 GGDEF domain-containing protein [Cellulomonas sp. ATA003]
MKPLAQDEEQVLFWRRHAVLGVLLCTVLPAVAVLDTWMSDAPAHEALRYGICLTVMVLSPLLLLVPVGRVVRHPAGRLFFDAWETAGLTLVLTMAVLDGGAYSPYLQMLYILLAHAALAYPPGGMVVAGALAVTGFLGVSLTGGAPDARYLVTGALLLTVTTGTCAFASHNHVRAYRRTASRARRVERLAELDGLTGCVNNRTFHERLADAAEVAGPAHPLSLLVIDIDQFKSVNDGLGHPAGDAVLQRVGAILRGVSRAIDTAGRLGGDEFALLLPATTTDDAVRVAERVREQVRAVTGDGAVTVSVGVATCATDRTDPAALMAAADRAVYRAKATGRDRVVRGAADAQTV